MQILYLATIVLSGASLLASPHKTWKALRIALERFLQIAPPFIVMLLLVPIVLYLVPEPLLTKVLAQENKWIAVGGAIGLGSVSIMPGFIAFPLCGILRNKGALYMVISAFSTSLMMVGVVTFPLERAYLGTRLALSRNAVSLAIAVVVALATGFYFGELP
ncbi:MAG: hypothetical protein P8130_01560 [Deltaproteobacteria bacterium]